MSFGFGPMVLPAASDPCGSVTITSVTITIQDNGSCPTGGLTYRVTVVLSGSLEPGQTLEYNWDWRTSSGTDPGTGGPTQTGLTKDYDQGLFEKKTTGPSGTTYYANARVRLIGSDGTTICDNVLATELSANRIFTCTI